MINKRIHNHVSLMREADCSLLDDKLGDYLEQVTGLDFMHLLAKKRPSNRAEAIALYEKYFAEDDGTPLEMGFIETFMGNGPLGVCGQAIFEEIAHH